VSLHTAPGSPRGYIDVLFCAPKLPQQSAAYRVKRIKFGLNQLRNGTPGKLARRRASAWPDPWTLRDETTDALKVLHVISGSPAFRMRVQPDDLIEAIDDVPTKTMPRDEAFKRMAENSGTVVQLSIRRGAKRLHVSVTRELLTVRTVSATMVTELGTRFGYLALSQFGKDSAREVRNALVEMLKSNAEGIVLDLRNNLGGFVPASREIAGLLLSGKAVLYHSIDRTGSAKDFESTGAPLISGRWLSSLTAPQQVQPKCSQPHFKTTTAPC
jgi:hypothetical protein